MTHSLPQSRKKRTKMYSVVAITALLATAMGVAASGDIEGMIHGATSGETAGEAEQQLNGTMEAAWSLSGRAEQAMAVEVYAGAEVIADVQRELVLAADVAADVEAQAELMLEYSYDLHGELRADVQAEAHAMLRASADLQATLEAQAQIMADAGAEVEQSFRERSEQKLAAALNNQLTTALSAHQELQWGLRAAASVSASAKATIEATAKATYEVAVDAKYRVRYAAELIVEYSADINAHVYAAAQATVEAKAHAYAAVQVLLGANVWVQIDDTVYGTGLVRGAGHSATESQGGSRSHAEQVAHGII